MDDELFEEIKAAYILYCEKYDVEYSDVGLLYFFLLLFMKVLNFGNNKKIHQKIFSYLVCRRKEKLTYFYCKILAVIRKIIINGR